MTVTVKAHYPSPLGTSRTKFRILTAISCSYFEEKKAGCHTLQAAIIINAVLCNHSCHQAENAWSPYQETPVRPMKNQDFQASDKLLLL